LRSGPSSARCGWSFSALSGSPKEIYETAVLALILRTGVRENDRSSTV